MLRLALLLLSLAAAIWTSTHAGSGGGWDPNGQMDAPPVLDSGGGWDPDGRTATAPTPDIGGGWDPDGRQ